MVSGLVSVVVPCRNEVNHISKCVESIFASKYEHIECLVVDGMSTDGTRELLRELAKRYSGLKILDNPHKLTPYAFNIGVQNARGEYIQIVGSRNILDAEYIPTMIEGLKDPEVGCVGGRYQHIVEEGQKNFINFAMESKFGVGGSNYRVKNEDAFVDTVGVPMYRRNLFDEIGFFDEQLTRNQDDDFNFRVREKGYKILYIARTKSLYKARSSLAKAFRQFSQYGYFKVFVGRKHKALTTLRQIVPAAFLMFLVVGLILSLLVPNFSYFYGFVLILYFILGFFSVLKFSTKLSEIFRIQWAIFVLHLGYGMGYIHGVLDFIFLKRKYPRGSYQNQTT